MVLKRKRSMAGFESVADSSSSCSESSSPAPFYPEHVPVDDMMDMEGVSNLPAAHNPWIGSSSSRYLDSHQLNSRTRKRLRDDRPNEDTIFETTYQKLYQAQHVDFSPPAVSSPHAGAVLSTSFNKQSQSQSTLHKFWTLPPRSTAGAIVSSFARVEPQQQCEDCDVWFAASSEHAMDLGNIDTREDRCGACGRLVCGTCSVTAGSRKECLQCRTSSRRWVGLLGWATRNT